MDLQLIEQLVQKLTNYAHKRNSTTSHISAAHGWFSDTHKVAPVCTKPSTCFLGPNRLLNPNGISI